MHLVPDNNAEALATLKELIAEGLAGNDVYQAEIFCVDTPDPEQRDQAETALDQLHASFHKNGAYGAPRSVIQCRLPRWVRAELGLDERNAPTVVVPLASRGLTAAEHRELGSSPGEVAALRGMNYVIDRVLH